jgi:hypothetical protein
VRRKLVREISKVSFAKAGSSRVVSCGYCKEPLRRKRLKFCGRECYLRYSVEVAKPIEKAQIKLAEMRAEGLNPGHGGEAAKKRGAKLAESNRKRALNLTPEQRRKRRAEQMRGYRALRPNRVAAEGQL